MRRLLVIFLYSWLLRTIIILQFYKVSASCAGLPDSDSLKKCWLGKVTTALLKPSWRWPDTAHGFPTLEYGVHVWTCKGTLSDHQSPAAPPAISPLGARGNQRPACFIVLLVSFRGPTALFRPQLSNMAASSHLWQSRFKRRLKLKIHSLVSLATFHVLGRHMWVPHWTVQT